MNKSHFKKIGVFAIILLLQVVFFVSCTDSYQKGEDMQELTYSLRTNFDEFSNEELDAILFDEIIKSFEPDIWDFMVLSPDKPINNCAFIQVGAPDEITNYQYTLEVGFETIENGLTLYRLYTTDKDTVLQYFVNYWQDQIIPDISTWEDVSWEMR
jgi:hypothetical protein